MATKSENLHIFFLPFMAPGHMNPLIDMARLFAARGVQSTILTTPVNALHFQSTIDRDIQSGLPIQTLILTFPPTSQTQLPENCESGDLLPSRDLTPLFVKALPLLQPQTDHLVRTHAPDAIVSDINFPWTAKIAHKYNIPRILFNGTSCFSMALSTAVHQVLSHVHVASDSEPFPVPDLPDPIEVSKEQLPFRFMRNMDLTELFNQIREADDKTQGIVGNSFHELEPDYVALCEKQTGKKVWTVGPVSLFNQDFASKSTRGRKSSIDEHLCVSWLDSMKPKSVLYVCFGSMCRLPQSQIQEIGSGLEQSGHPFIWVVKESDSGGLPEGFEERVEGRGLVIKGWAPQVLILSHESVGGFMTHCGWNSVLESVSVGLPMITWPLFGEQFYNEKFVVNVARCGVGSGVQRGYDWGEEETSGILVSREGIRDVVTRFMGEGDEEMKEIRKQAKRLGELARETIREGGSSYENMGLLIKYLLCKKKEQLSNCTMY